MARSSPALLSLAAALLLAAAGLGLWLLLRDDGAPPSGAEEPIAFVARDAEVIEPELPEPVPPPDRPRPPTRPESAPRATVVGRVVDRAHEPVGRGRVLAMEGSIVPLPVPQDLRPLGATAELGPDGRFRLEDVPLTRQFALRLEGGAFQLTDLGPFSLPGGTTFDVGDLVVDPGLHVHGRVLDQHGQGLAGARVGLYESLPESALESDAEPVRLVLCAEDGAYELHHVPRRAFLLGASSPGLAGTFVAAAEPEDEQQTEVELLLVLQPGEPLAGRVVDKDTGAGLAGARVLAMPEAHDVPAGMGSAVSGADGSFTIESLLRAAYSVTATARGYGVDQAMISSAGFDQPILLRLKPHGSISGVVLAEGDQPARTFDLLVKYAAAKYLPGQAAGTFRRVADEAGAFVVDDLEPGFYTFEVWGPGYALTISEAVRVKPGEHVTGIAVRLKREARLRGLVLDDLGTPVEGARVALHPNREAEIEMLRGTLGPQAWMRSTTTAGDGTFELTEVTGGIYQVEVDHLEHALLRINDVAVASESEQELAPLTITRAATVTGSVLDIAGTPQPNVNVTLSPQQGYARRVQSDGHGRFLFDRVLAGTYTLEAYGAQSNPFAVLQATIKTIETPLPTFVVVPGEISKQVVHVLQ